MTEDHIREDKAVSNQSGKVQPQAKRWPRTAGFPVPGVLRTTDSLPGDLGPWTEEPSPATAAAQASLTRTDLDELRARIADEAGSVQDEREELAELAWLLLYELERARMRHGLVRSAYARLLGAARAAVAASARGEAADPLDYVRYELSRHGQLPPHGVPPAQLLADAAATAALLGRVG